MSQSPYTQYVAAMRPVHPLANAYATLWLRPGAPELLVKAAYRALAQIYHPDVGGDAETMKRINAAYAMLRGQAR